jgi:hypothetical protein
MTESDEKVCKDCGGHLFPLTSQNIYICFGLCALERAYKPMKKAEVKSAKKNQSLSFCGMGGSAGN